MLDYDDIEVINMLISEVCKITKLTKKAIEYYTLQEIVSPNILENGYRDYNDKDIEILIKVSVLRKLDISIEEIKEILNDKTNSALQVVSLKKALNHQRDIQKNSILQKLSRGKIYSEINGELQAIEHCKTITDKLLEAFPGYYGRFICMHFARFFNKPIETASQQAAYETILSFLDDVPVMEIPKDVEEFLIENTRHIGTEQISEVLEATKKAYQKPDEFLRNNKEILEQYIEFKKSDEYKNSPVYKLNEAIKSFNKSNGYNDVFIPAMKQLSASYAQYYIQMEEANEKFLKQYPQFELE